MKLDDEVLMNETFRGLCRVLKNRKIYCKFRCFMGCSYHVKGFCMLEIPIYSVINRLQRYILFGVKNNNPFIYAPKKKYVFSIIKNMFDKSRITKSVNDIYNEQTYIVFVLNTLLHFCVEPIVYDLLEIEKIGQETFDLVCKKLYGEDFIDKTEKDAQKEIKSMIDTQKVFPQLGNDRMRVISEANAKTFLEYISKYKKKIDFVMGSQYFDDDIEWI